MLVQELLLGRTEGLSGPALAAFIDGWSSLLSLVRRTDLCLPDSPPEIHEAIAELVAHIEKAQAEVVGDPEADD